jgi:hypothetical protein
MLSGTLPDSRRAPNTPAAAERAVCVTAMLQAGRAVNPAGERRLRPTHHVANMCDGVDLLLIYSRADRWTPVAFGDTLAAAESRPERVRRVTLEHADHTHGLRDEPQAYWDAVDRFLA